MPSTNRSYILSFGHEGDFREITDFLNTIPEVVNWHYCFPHTCLLAMSLTARKLSERMEKKFPGLPFIILQFHARAGLGGQLPPELWEAIHFPGPPPKPPPSTRK